MLSALHGPGLNPSEGADPTEPSDRAGSVPDRESVLSRVSEDDIGIGNLICNGTHNDESVQSVQCEPRGVKPHFSHIEFLYFDSGQTWTSLT